MLFNVLSMKIMENHKVCRACLATKEEFYNLFTETTSEMFTFCTALEVSTEDSLPKVLCSICFDLLEKLFNFKKKCIESNRTLQNCAKIGSDVKPNIEMEIEINKNDIKIEVQDSFISDFKENNVKLNGCVEKSILTDIGDINLGENIFSSDLNEGSDSDFNQSINVSMTTVGRSDSKKRKRYKKKTELKVKWRKKLVKERKNFNLDHPCLQCNKKFAYPERLEAHKKLHDGGKDEISCHICDKKFKQWHGLRRHNEFVHMTTGKSLECPTCRKLYKTSMTLRNHQKLHQKRKDFVCHICGGSYKSAGGLQNHVDTHTENREKNHECKICGKKFVSTSYLTSHMFRHKDRRFVCDTCRFPFFTKADLSRHMLIHNGIKPFICEICNKSYSTKSFLIEHGRIHSGERPFNCDFCSMNFISKRRLIDHRRTHTGEKPHKCDKCNQAFIQRGSLTRHLKVHEK